MLSRQKGIGQPFVLGVFLLGMLFPGPVFGQGKFPSRPITLVVGYSPGGGVGNQAQILAEVMKKHVQQPVVVNFKPGAGAAIAADYVAKSEPDWLYPAFCHERYYRQGHHGCLHPQVRPG